MERKRERVRYRGMGHKRQGTGDRGLEIGNRRQGAGARQGRDRGQGTGEMKRERGHGREEKGE